MTRRRRRLPWVVLAALFVAVPLTEIYLIVQLGQVVGPWWTILLLIGSGILGSVLVRREGRRAWRALQEALSSGRMPATELADGALILVGGTLLITPGFITDVVGLVVILPLTRPLARRALAGVVARRLTVMTTSPRPGGPAQGPWGGPASGPGPGPAPGPGGTPPRRGPEVVPGEVVDDS
jgi:UPF0716 protein FxsA